MNTLTNSLLKRALSILLVTIMVFSLGIVGITTTSAAEVDLAETGATAMYLNLSSSDKRQFTESNGTYTLTTDIAKGTYNSISFTYGSFTLVCGTTITDTTNGAYTIYSGTGHTLNFVSTNGGTYTFSFYTTTVQSNFVQGQLTVTMSSGGNTGGDSGGTVPTTLYLDATYWNNAENIEKYSAVFTVGTTTTTVAMTLVEGNIYSVSVPANATKVKFLRLDGNGGSTDGQQWNYSAEMNIPTDGTNLNTINGWDGATGTWSTYVPADPDYIPGTGLWVDTNPNHETDTLSAGSKPIDWVSITNSTKRFYLPSNVDLTQVKFHYEPEDATLIIDGETVANGGTVDLSTKTGYSLSGSFSSFGGFDILQSSGVSTMYTHTKAAMPTTTGSNGCEYEDKDEYSTTGSILVADKNGAIRTSYKDELTGTTKIGDATLKKIKGRGNSSWTASYDKFGKYAFNLTLGEKMVLIDGATKNKKYCLLANNADEARMRNMVIYNLAEEIGVEFVADFEVMDVYNNNLYVGSYLLTEKVEIGNPLVDLDVDLDDENKTINEAIYDIEDEEWFNAQYRGYENGDSINECYNAEFYKYVIMDELPLDANGDPVYKDSGFLLELELDERFASEISGFVSSQGQQVVCKYPEYATKNQMEFIKGKWDAAEAVIYSSNPSYEDLSQHIDVESFAKMYLIQELSKNLDACATSYYVYYNEGKLHAGVTWDYDWTLGQYYKDDTNDRVLSTGNFTDVNGNVEDIDGWWANSKEIYSGTSKFNIQAQLCQGEDFWNVVKAEWNELFYSTASNYVTESDTCTEASGLDIDSQIYKYYALMEKSIAMDEAKWHFIANNPLSDWSNTTDTGATFSAAVVWLNDWMYDRLNWMNTNDLDSNTYTLAAPELALSSDVIDLGAEVTITATCNSSGNITYTLCDNNGDVITGVTPQTSSDGEVQFKYTPDVAGVKELTVKVSSANTDNETSSAVESLTVNETEFNLNVTLGCSSAITAPYNKNISFNPSTNYNGTENVTYSVLKSDSENGTFTVVDGATTSVKHTADDIGKTYYYKVVANVEDYTDESDVVAVTITDYSFNVQLKASAVTDGKFTLTASVPDFTADFANAEIDYIFYDSTGAEIATVSGVKGTHTVIVTDDMLGKTLEYSVLASVSGNLYNNPDYNYSYSKRASTNVTIQDTSAPVNVVFKFKAPDTLAYQPNLTVTVAGEKVADNVKLETDRTLITINKNQTASYYWYSYTLEDVKNTSTLNFTVKATRNYFYSGVAEFKVADTTDYELSQDGTTYTYYFALENLNYGGNSPLVNVTKLDQPIAEGSNVLYRDVTLNIANMISGPEAQADLVASGYTFRAADFGDANCDGKINIKDATYVQKSLANIVVADDLSTIVSDVTGDGKVTIKDATAIQKQLAGL